jgi:hypothetical protein
LRIKFFFDINIYSTILFNRSKYKLYISQIIKSNEIIKEMKFSYFNRNQIKPILLVKPKAKVSKYWSFAIYAYPESDQKFFKSVRFSPQKNNVRSDAIK